jgi:hypothetical protein
VLRASSTSSSRNSSRFAAPADLAEAWLTSAAASALALNGAVTFSPRTPLSRRPSTKRSKPPSDTAKGT